MDFLDAERVMRLCGAGRVLHLGGSDDALVQALTQRGALAARDDRWTGGQADAVVAEAQWLLEQGEPASTFARLRAASQRWLVVRIAGGQGWFDPAHGPDRAGWESAAIAGGWRRAPQQVSVDDYREQHTGARPPHLLAFEKVPDAALSGWPPEPLRDSLHMDSLRDSKVAACARMVRYAVAASLVRPGDTVLDCGCGAGYGSAILAAQSAGAHFIGIEPDPGALAYARQAWEQYGIEFRTGGMEGIADASADVLVAFGVLERAGDVGAFLREAQRVLKPDGRIIVSVPWRRVDEEGRTFDHEAAKAALSAHFLVEERWAQTAPSMLDRLAPGAPDTGADWLLLVASNDPLSRPAKAAYRHPAFGDAASVEGCWLVDFAAHFDNPWLYRPMVQLGERLRDRAVLLDLVGRVLGQQPMASADFGAALTVLAYSLVEQPVSGQIDDALALVEEYLRVDSDNPHLHRWQISAAYAAARLALVRGDRALAQAFLAAVEAADFLAFSPLLATKAIAASFQLGAMALADGDEERARLHFGRGTASARKALHADDLNAIGNPAAPLAFGFMELAEVADMGGQCANALAHLPLYRRNPGLFWQRVDVKRFGVVSWAQAVERENAQLRRQLAG